MTVRELESDGRELFLLCGTDMILSFDAWYCFEEIMQKCTLVCIRRESDKEIEEKLAERLSLYKERYGAKIVLLSVPALEMSSTEVREAIANGDDTSSMLPQSILKYVKDNKLYTD